MSLKTYRAKRAFEESPEPKGKKALKMVEGALQFVVQKHAARRLHYDLRLEMDGVLKSWAVPKGPSMDPQVKRLAIQVEDHPLEYATFEGKIPEGQYGAGQVIVWDQGTYSVKGETREEQEKNALEQLEKGDLKFFLSGSKLKGEFALVRLKKDFQSKEWLLIKKKDEYQSGEEITDHAESVLTGKTIVDPKSVPKAPMPHGIKPMLAFLTEEAFDGKNWIFEIKWDGYRAIAEISGGHVQLYSRNKQPFNDKFPQIVQSLRKLQGEMILDGEIVVLDKEGRSQFQQLQNVLQSKENEGALKYCVFDILYYKGRDLRHLPLIQRKEILKGVLEGIGPSPLIYPDYIEEKGKAFFREAVKKKIEGIIAKEINSSYVSVRSRNWLKIKATQRQEAVVAGFTQPRGGRKYIGALVIGVYNKKGELEYAGNVGGGFTQQALKEAYRLLEPLIVRECPFKYPPQSVKGITWVKPKLLCEVVFQEWTKEGIMRQPVFQGFRTDKPAKEVKKEMPVKLINNESADVALADTGTNLDKIFWPGEGFTKGDLLHYYQEVSPFILPHLKDRPIMLKRYPDGIAGDYFFQKTRRTLFRNG